MSPITGNKGEWSEIYAFLKLLAMGRLDGADKNVEVREDLYYNINRIIRNEDGDEYEYVILEDGENAEVRTNGKTLLQISRKEILEHADYLLDHIRNSSGSFSDDRTEDFMTRIGCHKLKAPSKDKSDIVIEIHDHRTGLNPVLGFSIKSMLGSESTLVNASKATNFTFLLKGDPDIIRRKQAEINERIESGKRRNLNAEYQDFVANGIEFEFLGADNRYLRSNIRLLDGDLPEIIAEMLKLYYIEGVKRISDQVKILNERNPLHFDRPDEIPSYESKIKRLLSAYALGMQSGSPWNGVEEASGGYIIVRNDGEVLCYHLYNRNDFDDYLFWNTVMDTASTSRHGFSTIENDIDGTFSIKLNLQIRFMRV